MRAELVKTEKVSDTMTNKMTYVKALEMAIASLPADFNEEAMEKLIACKTSYEKRNASKSKGERKPTKKQIENEGIKARIVELLTDHEPMQAKEVAAELELSSSQQASALLRQLVEAGTVEKVVEKRVSRFQVKGE